MAKLAQGKTLQTSTIPIRGISSSAAPATPTRLAASAPATSTLSPSTVASPGAMTRMSGALRPRQTTARLLINAAAARQPPPQSSREDSRVRKERSGSLTPGPLMGLPVDPVTEAAKGKRVKV